jgi:S-layer homology domain/Mannosyl-glycoprotein endo-beta-N-acetylglucosaminidase
MKIRRPTRHLALLAGALAAVLLGILAQPCPAVAEAAGFSDVPATHLYHIQIEVLAQLGIIEGFSDGTFRPEAPVTREQLIDMFNTAMGTTLSAANALNLVDLASSSVNTYATTEVRGEVVGHLSSCVKRYEPGATVTVAQLVSIGAHSTGRALSLPLTSFAPVWGEFDDTYAPIARFAQYNGLLRGLVAPGKTLASLSPLSTATRGQAAAVLFNVMGTDPDSLTGRFLGDYTDLLRYFRQQTGGNDGKFTVSLETLAKYYITYGERFGIRADMAWAQMIHETGYGQYGGDVEPWQNNMAGIGATGGGVPGNSFATAELGVIAQYAHLAWYVYPEHLTDPYCVKVTQPVGGPITTPGDPRHFVQADGNAHKGTAHTVYDLSGTWAVGAYYGAALQRIAAAIPVTCGLW